MLEIKILDINETALKPFGEVLVPPSESVPEVFEEGIFKFYVTFKEEAKSWQIGYLDQIGKKVDKLECHPNTSEVFVPLHGDAVMLLSINPQEDIFAFKLDKPIVLYKGVWHGVISLSANSKMLIVESSDVIDQYHDLQIPIDNRNLK